MSIPRTTSFDGMEWAENDYRHPADRAISPIPKKAEKWHDWIFSDADISELTEDMFKLCARRCRKCNKILAKDAPFQVKFCSIACRQLGKR